MIVITLVYSDNCEGRMKQRCMQISFHILFTSPTSAPSSTTPNSLAGILFCLSAVCVGMESSHSLLPWRMSAFHMASQVTPITTLELTVRTLVWLLACVDAGVSCESACLCKPLPTHHTFIGSFPGVKSHMHPKVLSFITLISTHLTLERLFLRVGQHVTS